MPALVVPGAALVTLTGQFLGTPWANVYGILYDNSSVLIDQAGVDELANDFRAFHVAINGLQSVDWSLTGITLADLRATTSPSWEAVISPLAGAATGDNLAPQVSAVASHRTGLRGKSYAGRTYLNGFTEASNTVDGQIDAAARTSILSAYDALDSNLAGLAGIPCVRAVVSRKLLVATEITSTTIDTEWDRQDRRKRR